MFNSTIKLTFMEIICDKFRKMFLNFSDAKKRCIVFRAICMVFLFNADM